MKKFSIALLICNTITCGLCAGGGSSAQEEIQKSKVAQSEISEQTTSTIEPLRKKRLRSSRSSSCEYHIDSLFGASSSTPIEDLSAGLIEESEIKDTTPTPAASIINDDDNLLDQLLSDLKNEQLPKESIPQIVRPKFKSVLEALQNNDAKFFKKYYKRLDYKDDHRWIQLIAEAQTNITDQKTNFKTAKEALIKNKDTITQMRGALTRALMIQQYIQSAQKQLASKESCERIEELKQMVQLHRQERIAQMLAFNDCKTK